MRRTVWYYPKTSEYTWEKPKTEEIDPPEYTLCRAVECDEGMHGETYLLSSGKRIDVWCSVGLADAFAKGRYEYYQLEASKVFKEHGISWNEVVSKICLYLQPSDFEAFIEEHRPYHIL